MTAWHQVHLRKHSPSFFSFSSFFVLHHPHRVGKITLFRMLLTVHGHRPLIAIHTDTPSSLLERARLRLGCHPARPAVLNPRVAPRLCARDVQRAAQKVRRRAVGVTRLIGVTSAVASTLATVSRAPIGVIACGENEKSAGSSSIGS